MKSKILILIIAITTLIMSCAKEKDICTCTILLNGDVWSEQTVTDCDDCSAPNGYTSECNC